MEAKAGELFGSKGVSIGSDAEVRTGTSFRWLYSYSPHPQPRLVVLTSNISMNTDTGNEQG